MKNWDYHKLAHVVLVKSQCVNPANAMCWLGHALVCHQAAQSKHLAKGVSQVIFAHKIQSLLF